MNCPEARAWIPALVDGELDPAREAGVRAHLEACPECAAFAARQRAVRELVRNGLPRFEPPAALATRIRAELRAVPVGAFRRPGPWAWLGSLGAVAAALAIGFAWGAHRPGPAGLGAELVSDHVRAQAAGHLFDVASSDRHTVKPWLAHRLSFSPRVVDLAPGGFPLLGGRLDRVRGGAAAALVYQFHQHVITLYVWPAEGAEPAAAGQRLGYEFQAWREADLDYAALSDTAPATLAEFVRQFRSTP